MLEAEGYEIVQQSLLSDDYLNNKFAGKKINLLLIAKFYLKRLLFILKNRDAELAIVYMEVFPYLPYWIENFLLLKSVPYIVDIDDAIFLNYQTNRGHFLYYLLKNKFGQLFANARAVFSGSPFLSSIIANHGATVLPIPTVVDMNYYSVTKKFDDLDSRPITIGWMGSPSTARNLTAIQPALKEVVKKFNAKLFFVGSGPLPEFNSIAEIKDWSIHTELEDLRKMDIGIMPLEDNEWNRGKCGFKIIQYMAIGLPTVGSPVGVNSEIIENNVTGYLASTHEEWVSSLSQLINDRMKLRNFGTAGRKRAQKIYSLQATLPLVSNAVRTYSSAEEL